MVTSLSRNFFYYFSLYDIIMLDSTWKLFWIYLHFSSRSAPPYHIFGSSTLLFPYFFNAPWINYGFKRLLRCVLNWEGVWLIIFFGEASGLDLVPSMRGVHRPCYWVRCVTQSITFEKISPEDNLGPVAGSVWINWFIDCSVIKILMGMFVSVYS